MLGLQDAAKLAARTLLVVLDDTWTDIHAQLFCTLPASAESGSVVLLTTRIAGLLGSNQPPRANRAREYVLGTFSDQDGASLLRSAPGINADWGELTEETVEALLSACARLPLAIGIVSGAAATSSTSTCTSI